MHLRTKAIELLLRVLLVFPRVILPLLFLVVPVETLGVCNFNRAFTFSMVVIKNVVLPYAFPISLANVSDNFVASEVTNLITYNSLPTPKNDEP